MTTKAPALQPFDDGRLTGVFLENGYVLDEDPDYGPCIGYCAVSALTEQVAVALSLRPGRLRGVEFQYIRKAMRWPRAQVAENFGRTELTVTNWESHNKVPLEASLLMKQNCLKMFGYAGQALAVLDQQGQTGFAEAQIIMRFDPQADTWRSNFHLATQRLEPRGVSTPDTFGSATVTLLRTRTAQYGMQAMPVWGKEIADYSKVHREMLLLHDRSKMLNLFQRRLVRSTSPLVRHAKVR